ncbi:MAG: hypothetical protein ACKOT0_10805 [bacterium]
MRVEASTVSGDAYAWNDVVAPGISVESYATDSAAQEPDVAFNDTRSQNLDCENPRFVLVTPQ